MIGLQTPRLKRLAEIVSAQAIAQQEKIDSASGVTGSIEEGEGQEQAEENDQVLELDAEEKVGANGV